MHYNGCPSTSKNYGIEEIMKTIAFINTPIKAGDLYALISGEMCWELTIDVNEDGVLVIKD